MPEISERQLRYLEFVNRENAHFHHTNEADNYQYELIKQGNVRAGAENRKILLSGQTGKVSEDALRNQKYLFVASVTLACRAAMAAGLDSERAYNISDLYIQKMDLLTEKEAVIDLSVEMMEFYAREVAALEKQKPYSLLVMKCMNYISYHLHEKITVTQLAELTATNPSYLSTLFRKETGMKLSGYITQKRIETAKNMLRFSDYSYSEIATILAFSSQSHFAETFRKLTGMTPKKYRERFVSRT